MRRVTVPSDSVVVVGCGSSTLIRELVDEGYAAIIAVDIAQPALDQLRASLGIHANSVTMVRSDARSVRLSRMVTLWHDRATFHFLTDAADQAAYAATAARSVEPGGHLVLAEFAMDGPPSCSGLNVARHSAASLQSAFCTGFELIESCERDHITPSGVTQRFVHALMIRRAMGSVVERCVVGSDDLVTSPNPCLMSTDQVTDRAESEKSEIGGSQRGAVATVADNDQRLVLRADRGVAISVGRVTGPFQDGARDVDRTTDHPEAFTIDARTGVDDGRWMWAVEGRAQRSRFDAVDTRPGVEQKIMDRGPGCSAVDDPQAGVDLVAVEFEFELGAHLLVCRSVGVLALEARDQAASWREVLDRRVHHSSAGLRGGQWDTSAVDDDDAELSGQLDPHAHCRFDNGDGRGG